MMDEQEFKTRADAALESLYNKLSAASDRYDFEPDFNSGALAIEFEQPKAKFVVSPNTPVRQIWVSAHSKSFKLDWDASRQVFAMPDSRQTLNELIASAIQQHLGEPVTL
ncbi:MAG TPA: iron donor protein CyaY [Bryobacteraceae bacterium]|nr:iron donor protein CyaY [Bryobacteraceae bacterium]